MTSSVSFRHLIAWFACARLSDLQLIPSGGTFSLTLTTQALYPCSLRCFGTCSCKPTPRGLPSSPVQPRGALPPTYAKFGPICDISYNIRKKTGLLKLPILFTNQQWRPIEYVCYCIAAFDTSQHAVILVSCLEKSSRPGTRPAGFIEFFRED